jgi:hypothetical protein
MEKEKAIAGRRGKRKRKQLAAQWTTYDKVKATPGRYWQRKKRTGRNKFEQNQKKE